MQASTATRPIIPPRGCHENIRCPSQACCVTATANAHLLTACRCFCRPYAIHSKTPQTAPEVESLQSRTLGGSSTSRGLFIRYSFAQNNFSDELTALYKKVRATRNYSQCFSIRSTHGTVRDTVLIRRKKWPGKSMSKATSGISKVQEPVSRRVSSAKGVDPAKRDRFGNLVVMAAPVLILLVEVLAEPEPPSL